MKTNNSKPRFGIRDFIIPIIVFLVTFSFLIFLACSKENVFSSPVKISFPVSYSQSGCPYPPGCTTYIPMLIEGHYASLDKNLSVTLDGNTVTFTTSQPELYHSLKRIDFTGDKIIFRTK